MDVQLSDEQLQLRESARDFLSRECDMSRVREIAEDPSRNADELWKKMSELGWMGLVFPEALGGAGLDWVDLAVLLEEMGRVLMPAPFLSSVALAGPLISAAGSEAQRDEFVPAIAAGRLVATVAQLEAHADWSSDGIQLAWNPDRPRLDGVKLFVPDGDRADLLVVPVRSDTRPDGSEGITLLLVHANAPGVSARSIAYTDATRRLAEITFDGVSVATDAVLGEVGRGWPALERALDHAKVALCAEMCGGAERVLELSVAFAKTREQFGKPIGSFQAIQHKCADMLVQLEAARSATYYAAWSLAESEPDAHTSACLAKAFCSEAFAEIAAEGVQIHGGLGFTWEQDLHFFYKRAKAAEIAFGDPSWNRELAARDLLDAEPLDHEGYSRRS